MEIIVVGRPTVDLYIDGAGSGGGSGRGGCTCSKLGRDDRKAASSPDLVQRAKFVRAVGWAAQSKRWSVMWSC